MSEVNTDLDRRSLIRKGLVGAGIAASAPIVSSFNAPVLANHPGSHTLVRYQFRRDSGSSNNFTSETPTDGGACEPAFWDDLAAGAAGPTVQGNKSITIDLGTAGAFLVDPPVDYTPHAALTRSGGCTFGTANDGDTTLIVTMTQNRTASDVIRFFIEPA